MSFFKKVSSLFNTGNCQTTTTKASIVKCKQNPEILGVLIQVMNVKPFNVTIALDIVITFLKTSSDNTKNLFEELQKPMIGQCAFPRPDGLIRLLQILHLILMNPELKEEISSYISNYHIYWFTKLYNKEVSVSERLEAEPSFSTSIHDRTTQIYIDTQANQQDTPKDISRQQKKEDRTNQSNSILQKRKLKVQELQQKILNETKKVPLIPSEFAQLYYSYLQRASANIVQQRSYEPKLRFLWLYKIQNLMSTGLKLIETINRSNWQAQLLIYEDLIIMQEFLSTEIIQLTQNYQLLLDSDALSLYEIYMDILKSQDHLYSFFNESIKYQQVLSPIPNIDLCSQMIKDFVKSMNTSPTVPIKKDRKKEIKLINNQQSEEVLDTQQNDDDVRPFFSSKKPKSKFNPNHIEVNKF